MLKGDQACCVLKWSDLAFGVCDCLNTCVTRTDCLASVPGIKCSALTALD